MPGQDIIVLTSVQNDRTLEAICIVVLYFTCQISTGQHQKVLGTSNVKLLFRALLSDIWLLTKKLDIQV